MKLITILSVLNSTLILGQAQINDTIYSVQITTSDYRYEETIEAYKKSINWTLWSFPMENKPDSVPLENWKTIDYYVQNINDHNLNTAWIRNEKDTTKKIEFEFQFKPGYTCYSSAYQFFGQINLFNGNLESLSAWLETGRIKTIKIYYNQISICFVRLIDTWHFQYFTFEHFFKNKYFKKYLSAPYEIKSRDKLTFEVTEFYQGTNGSNFALSEFLIQGASN